MLGLLERIATVADKWDALEYNSPKETTKYENRKSFDAYCCPLNASKFGLRL